MSLPKKPRTSINEILEEKMECLDLNQDFSSSTLNSLENSVESSPEVNDESPVVRRSTRRRSMSVTTENRRVIQKPIKKVSKIESIYLSRSVKRLPPNLETIFEEPKMDKNRDILYIGLRKQKRIINFAESSSINKNKVKKRQLKAKKVNSAFMKRKRLSMDAVIEKLNHIE